MSVSPRPASWEIDLAELSNTDICRLSFDPIPPLTLRTMNPEETPMLRSHTRAFSNDRIKCPIERKPLPSKSTMSVKKSFKARTEPSPISPSASQTSLAVIPPAVPPKDDYLYESTAPRSVRNSSRFEVTSGKSLLRTVLDAPMFRSAKADAGGDYLRNAPNQALVGGTGTDNSALLAAGQYARQIRSPALESGIGRPDTSAVKHTCTIADPRQTRVSCLGEDASPSQQESNSSELESASGVVREQGEISSSVTDSSELGIEAPTFVRRLNAIHSGRATSISVIRSDQRLSQDVGMDMGIKPRFNSRASTIRRSSSPTVPGLYATAKHPPAMLQEDSRISASSSHPLIATGGTIRRASTLPSQRTSFAPSSVDASRITTNGRPSAYAPSPLDAPSVKRWNSTSRNATPSQEAIPESEYRRESPAVRSRNPARSESPRGRPRKRDDQNLMKKMYKPKEALPPPQETPVAYRAVQPLPLPLPDFSSVIILVEDAASGRVSRRRASIFTKNDDDDADDELLALTILKAYRELRGSFKTRFLARSIVDVQILRFDSEHNAIYESSNKLAATTSGFHNSNAHFLRLLMQPQRSRGVREWTNWLADVNAGPGAIAVAEPVTKAPKQDKNRSWRTSTHLDNNSSITEDDDDDEKATRRKHDRIILKLQEGWNARRILVTVFFVLGLSLAATLLYIFLGGGSAGQSEGSGNPTTTSSSSAAAVAARGILTDLVEPARSHSQTPSHSSMEATPLSLLISRSPPGNTADAADTADARSSSTTPVTVTVGWAATTPASRTLTGLVLGLFVLLLGGAAMAGWMLMSWLVM